MKKINHLKSKAVNTTVLSDITENDKELVGTTFIKCTEEMDQNESVKKEIMLGKRVGLYRIKGNLGNGNFSQVKLATHLLTKEEVAVKILDKTKLDAKTQKLLSGEIASMERLHHPNVIRLYEVIEDFHKLHIIMEYASGGELHSLIVDNGKIPEAISKLIFTQVVAALNHLHKVGVIHRDLKAENIFFAGNRPHNDNKNYRPIQKDAQNSTRCESMDYSFSRLIHVKLGDFGFSTIVQSMDKLTTFCGSPPYAAPELFQADWYYGPGVDIWAMGILLYFMLVGVMPFRGQSVGLLKKLILSGHFTFPQSIRNLTKDLIKGLLKQNPADRLNIEQIMTHAWLVDQTFPEAYKPFKSTPSVPQIETNINENINDNDEVKDTFESDSLEASKMLSRLGITDKHIEVAQAQTVRNYVTGTYRIILHRVHRNRRMSHIPQSISNPEICKKYFNNPKSRNNLNIRPRNRAVRSKVSTRSDEPVTSNQKSSKMCIII